MNKLSKIALKYNLGKVLEYELLNGSQNFVYKVVTDKDTYVIKEYTKDAIGNYYYLNKRKEQIRISKILKDKGIDTVIPLSYNNKYFLLFQNKYYLIYNFNKEQNKKMEEITLDNIRTLAKTQAKIHKLNIKSKLPCSYKHIEIDIDKQLKIAKKVNLKLYNKINDNKDIIVDMVSKCNKYTKCVKNNLCISHNDYKLLNILWKDNEVILIDFDATGLANPTSCLCESAFTFSKDKNKINYENYKTYLESYMTECKTELFLESLYAAVNGKLQWLCYMFSKNHLKHNNYIEGTISMIDELVLYHSNILKFNKIYEDIKK